jgi:hypothetical protein
MKLTNIDHHQWNRELLSDAYQRLDSKCYQAFGKGLTELEAEELDQLASYLEQDTLPVIKAIYAELLLELV